MARFVLMHLTPATRAAFRAYRDAVRASRTASEAAEVAYRALASVRYDIQRLHERGIEPSADIITLKEQRAERSRVLDEKANELGRAANVACMLALPLMEAEGYPFGWWHSGTMRLPQFVVSPGADRLRRRKTT